MQLDKVLRQRHVIALAFGAMIGWSWVLMSGLWIGRAGTLGAVLAFVLAGGAMLLVALTYAELAAAMPEIGGEHVYTERAFGRGWSFVCTWALLFGYVSVVAFEVVALPTALSYLSPAFDQWPLWQVAGAEVYGSHVLLGLGGAIALTLINVRGIGSAGNFQALVTVLIVLAGCLLLVGAAQRGSTHHLAPLFADGWSGVLGVVVMVPLMFVGFDVIPQAAEEIDLPPARIGSLMVVSVLCALAWYCAIILAVGFVLGPAARSTSTLTTATAASVAWGGEWAGTLLVLGGIAGIVTTWNAFLVGASRLIYVMAAAGLLPAWLRGDGQPQRALSRALWLIAAVSCLAPWFGRPALVWLVDAGSLAVIVAYALVALSFIALRRHAPDMPRPYRVPGGSLCGWLAFALSLGLGALYLPGSPSALVWPQEWAIAAIWCVAGVVLYRSRADGGA